MKEQVLDLANRAREALKLPSIKGLPKGIQDSQYYCPLALAIPGSFGVTVWSISFYCKDDAQKVAQAWETHVLLRELEEDYYYAVDLPPELSLFVQLFDEGKYPELVGEPGNDE